MNAIDQIKSIKAEIAERYVQIRAIYAACDHDWRPSSPERPEASGPTCVKCGEDRSGWWCEKSPTKECEYTDSEWCIHCGNPEERK